MSLSKTPDTPVATLANWRTAPYSRWGFRNVRALVPVAEIPHIPNSPRVLAETRRTLDGFQLKLRDGASLDFAGFLAATATDALIILRDGAIVHESYANGNDADTPHILMSATKSVVGLIAGILSARGELDIDAEVSVYVPEIAATAYRGATIRNLLDMRTGVVLDAREQQRYEAAASWDPVAPDKALGLHAFFATLSVPHAPHNGPFRYVSANTDLLGWAIERATSRRFADIASTLLWRPMGAAQSAFITTDGDGAPRCTGGLCATVRDLARLGQLIVEGGRRGDTTIVPSRWLDDIARGGDTDAWSRGEFGPNFAPISRNMSYRSGWYVMHDEPTLLFAMGIHGQNLFVDTANRMVIAKLSSQAERIDPLAMGLAHLAVGEIRRRLMRSAL